MNRGSISVVALSARATCGRLVLSGSNMKCALGRGGIRPAKREGDGATPAGIFDIHRVFYRPDRLSRPATLLPVIPLDKMLGWCDDPASARYNRLVRLPFWQSHEVMWRDDNLYDIVVELGFNDCPVIRGCGSAVFLHVAGTNYAPTEGCVAVCLEDMLRLVAQLKPGDQIRI